MKINTTLTTSYAQKGISLLCPNCYNTMDLGDIHYDLNIKLSPMMDQQLIEICPAFISNYPLENLHLLTRHVINVNCPYCKLPMIMVDRELIDILQLLNTRGYYTIASCAGHDVDENNNIRSSPYILFKEKLPDELVNRLHNRFDGQGLSYNMEGNFSINDEHTMIIPRLSFDKTEEERSIVIENVLRVMRKEFTNIPVDKRKYKTLYSAITSDYVFKYDIS